MAVLSSTVLNEKLKNKDYGVLDDAKKHFSSHPADVVSANKLCTALAYHIYHNRVTDGDAADSAAGVVRTCYNILEEGIKSKTLDAAGVEKAATSAPNILFKGFLRDGWCKHVSALAPALEAFHAAAGRPQDAAVFSALKGLADQAGKLMGGKPEVAKETRRRLEANSLAVMNAVLRLTSIHVLHLDLLVVEGRSCGKAAVLETGAALLKVAERQAMKVAKPESQHWSNARDQLVVACIKLGELASACNCAAMEKQFVAAGRRILTALCKATGHRPPLPRAAGCLVTAAEHQMEKKDDEGTVAVLSELESVLKKIETDEKFKSGQHVVNLIRGCSESLAAIVEYRAYQKQISEQAKELEQAQGNKEANEASNDAEDVKEIADVNPYLVGMSIAREEGIVQRLTSAVRSWSTACEATANFTASITGISSTLLLKIMSVAMYLLQLLGFDTQARNCAETLFKISAALSNQYFKLCSIYTIIMQDRALPAEPIKTDVRKMLHTLQNSKQRESSTTLFLPLALAWVEYHRGHYDQSKQLCIELLAFLGASSSGISSRVIESGVFRLLSRLQKTSSSFVGEATHEQGPLELITDAFRSSLIAAHFSRSNFDGDRMSSTNMEFFRAANAHMDVLEARVKVCEEVKLPKELRLYGKLSYEFATQCSLSTR